LGWLVAMILCFVALTACGDGEKSEKIGQLKELIKNSIALQQEIVNLLNDTIANGYEVSEEFGSQVNEIG
jgi:hypothetical protein